MTIEPRRPPRAFRLDEVSISLAGGAGDRTRSGTVIETAVDPYDAEADSAAAAAAERDEAAVEAAQKQGIVARSVFSWSGLFWSTAGGLVSLGVGFQLAQFVDNLFERAPTAGTIAVVLLALAGLALLVLVGREIASVARQRHIAALHVGLARAREADDFKEARRLVQELASLYTTRPQTARARTQLRQLAHDIVDGRDLIDIAERTLIGPLDIEVRREIANAAKRVSLVTALAPRAIIDVIFVAAQAIRLIRRISMIYGGRPGFFGFLKLLRSIGAHIAITGGMAAGDSILQQFVGHGIAAKVSARLGEGVLNGLLTARVGLSAMAVCRPLPFAATRAPGVSDVAPFLFKSDKKD